MREILENARASGIDAVVFDTPPTGLMLRVLTIPFVTTVWISKLMELRKAILDRRRMIERVLRRTFEHSLKAL